MLTRKAQSRRVVILLIGLLALLLILFAISLLFPKQSNDASSTPKYAGSFQYTVAEEDNLFGIANKFGLKPLTVLWTNEDKLHANPSNIKPGMVLRIPTMDGLYYRWKLGDKIEDLASQFGVKPQDILSWPENTMGIGTAERPDIQPGTLLFIPGGKKPLQPVPALP